MEHVISLGSINVDRIQRVSDSEIADLETRYDWFPDRGQTIEVTDVPEDFPDEFDSIRHGGKGANQAGAASKAGATATMLGKVGPDHEEFDVLAHLREAGIDVTLVDTASEPTGTAYVFVDSEGDNWIVVRPGANDTVDQTYVQQQYDTIATAECLLLQNEIPIEPVAGLLSDLATESDPPTVVLDPAPAEGAERLLEYDAVDYLTPNETEYEALQPYLDSYDGVVIRKRGGDDVIVEGDQRFTVTPPSVEVVDTTGAGDVLNGFVAARLASGASVQEAVEIGTIAGSLSTRRKGAQRGVPTLDDVRAFQESQAEET
ncbi:ribokinase [Halopenitus sp. H-Gu1]|uniref:ribokinase n=1 Tax=Halopenitus sp. H-Gu1 TaxID=3242697 RepID=UPI00359E0C72